MLRVSQAEGIVGGMILVKEERAWDLLSFNSRNRGEDMVAIVGFEKVVLGGLDEGCGVVEGAGLKPWGQECLKEA